MNKEGRELFGLIIGLPLGGLGAVWLVAWLFHLGPDVDKAWWALAYYLTAIVVSLGTWLGSATALYAVVQQLPLSASVPRE